MASLIALNLSEKAAEIPVSVAEEHASITGFEALVKELVGKLHCDADAPNAVLEVSDSAADDAKARLDALPLVQKGAVLVEPGATSAPAGTDLLFDPKATKVHWPADFDPAGVPTYVYNEVESSAPVEVVFAWLARATRWPEWYPNSANVELQSFAGPDLQLGTHFTWTTFGVHVDTYVEEFVPPYRIAWRGYVTGSDVVHAWVFERTPTGSRLITEEVQRGFVCTIAHDFFVKGLHENHQLWLERLAAQAETGLPS